MNRRIFPPIAIGTILILAVLVSSYFRSEARKVAPNITPSVLPDSPPVSEALICTDSDNGKDIYAKGSAATKKGEQTLHINSDSCATKNEIKSNENVADYIQGLADCSGLNCYVNESYCGEYEGSPLDMHEFIACPNDCNDGACLRQEVAKPVTVDVSNWQAYSDAKNNFDFKYPPGFIKQKATSSNNLLYLEKSSGGSLESIHIYLRKKFQIAEEFPESRGKLVDVNGRSVYKYFFQEGTGYSGVAFIQLHQDALEILYDAIGEENGGQLTKEELVKNNLDQIISTFRFADANAEVANGQTYRNEKYGFEFKYPNNIKITEDNEKSKLFSFSNEAGHFWIFIEDNPKKIDASEVKNDYYKSDEYGYRYQDSFPSIGGVVSYKQGRYDLGVIENYYIPKNDNIYKFNFEFNFDLPNDSLAKEKKDVINQILSTFKFIK